KGLAGLQGLPPIVDLAHDLEELLQHLRLNGAAPSAIEIDLIHEAHDALVGLTRRLSEGTEPESAEDLRRRLRVVAGEADPDRSASADDLALDPRVRASLSEYEERRLKLSAREAGSLFLLRFRLDPENFDVPLRALIRRLEERSEVIATVPLFGDDTTSGMPFQIIVFGSLDRAAIAAAAGGLPLEIDTLRIGGASGAGAPPPARGDDQGEEIRGVSETLRVPVARLDALLTQVGDLSIVLLALERAARRVGDNHPSDRDVRELGRQVRALQPRLRGLQRGTIDVRLVPLQQVFGRVGRMVSRAARAAGKEVDFHTLGGETELDKAMMDELASPLVHILRNALDHGIESPQDRLQGGKPRRGRLVLTAIPRGREVVIEIIDDGRGIDVEAVRTAAAAAGLIEPERAIGADEAAGLIFAEGFSTSGQVSQLSGRGVGLSVVRRAIRRLKGSIEVRSVRGQGTTFTITVPITMSLVPALIVKAGGQRFAIPITSIQENVRIDRSLLKSESGRTVYRHARGLLPLVRLETLVSANATIGEGEARFAVVAGPAGRAIGILVDAFVGQQDVVI
ncbi:MAG TPA: ATP-binding protein, partial [Candidatus Polarisedimenticolia bacterium]